MKQFRVGGSMAPNIDEAKLKAYEASVNDAKTSLAPYLSEIGDSDFVGKIQWTAGELLKMVRKFQETGQSKEPAKEHLALKGKVRKDGTPVNAAVLIPLEKEEIKRIWDFVPWDYEIDSYAQLFEKLPTGSVEEGQKSRVLDPKAKELRTACFHLLWYARELYLDREPVTREMVGL